MDASTVLASARIVPVVVLDNAEHAVPLGEILLGAGLAHIEVTLRTDAALAAIERLAANLPDLCVGAGSVRRVEQIATIRDAGASFAVSPGSTSALLDAATEAGLPLVPGAQTATEVMTLLARDYSLLKFFPAGLAGGIDMLRALGAPLPEASFFPTGGIRAETAADYLSLPNVRCIGGTWLAPASLLAAGDFVAIGELAAEAAAIRNSGH